MARIQDSSPQADRQQDLYEVLQVSPHATLDVIQAAYRALARTYHPDVNDSPSAARRMRQVNAAYAVLSDSGRRAKYDAIRARATHHRIAERREHRSEGEPQSATHSAGNIRSIPVTRPTRRTVVSAAPNRRAVPRPARTAQIVAIVTVLAVLVLILWMLVDSLDDRPRRLSRPHLIMPSSSIYDDSSIFNGLESRRWVSYAID